MSDFLICRKCGSLKRAHTHIVFHDFGFQLGEPGVHYCPTCDPEPAPPQVHPITDPEEVFGSNIAGMIFASLKEKEARIKALEDAVREMLKYECPRCDLDVQAAVDVYGVQLTITGVFDDNEEKEPR